MKALILVVDDEVKIVRLARDYLVKNGFGVMAASDGEMALSMFRDQKPDLIVLDLMLPKMDGLDVCRVIRQESAVPIIMLTARAEEVDRLIGLELGADDYIVKPFSPRELVARVRAVLRRVSGDVQRRPLIRVGDLAIDIEAHTVQRGDERLDLTHQQFQILALLAESPGRVFSREQILTHLHGYAHETYDRSIDAHIKNLRQRLEKDPTQPVYILTVYGVGYKFNDRMAI